MADVTEDIQEVFRLIREGNKNAFLHLNIKLRVLMNPDSNIGEITRIYHHYEIFDDVIHEINSDLNLIIIENILFEDKLNNMRNWTEFKWYCKRIAKILVVEYFRKKKIARNKFEFYDEYEFDDNGDMIINQFVENEEEIINYNENFEQECKEICDQILELISNKCKAIYRADLAGKTNQEMLIFLRKEYRIKDSRNLASAKNKCKESLKKKVREHNLFRSWKEMFENN